MSTFVNNLNFQMSTLLTSKNSIHLSDVDITDFWNADGVLCSHILMSSIFYDMQLLKIARIFLKIKRAESNNSPLSLILLIFERVPKMGIRPTS